MYNTQTQQCMQSVELPQCSICHLDPIPQSIQYIPFIIAEVILIFINVKLTIALLLLGYCFSRTKWYCQQCKRQIDVMHAPEAANTNMVIRVGNCMVLLSKFKFRVIAALAMGGLVYLQVSYGERNITHADILLGKDWTSLATHCGFEAQLQNSYKSNTLYSRYIAESGIWNLTGIYLTHTKEPNQFTTIHLKMNPTQFQNAQEPDLILHTNLTFNPNQPNKGDIFKFEGRWGQKRSGKFKFIPISIQMTGQKQDLSTVSLLAVAQTFLHEHESHQKIVIKNE